MNADQLLNIIRERLGIEALNLMQRRVWDSKASRLIILSPTGSGKTVAFAGAMLKRLPNAGNGVVALILAPSRELVLQIGEVLRSIAQGYKVATFYGSHPMQDEINTLRGNPDIIVATPGRMLDHLQRCTVSPAALKTLVIDEYDKSLELGFQGEMSRICRRMPAPRSVILTSATELKELPDFIDLKDAETIDCSDSGSKPRKRLHIARVESPVRDKLDTLVALLAGESLRRTIVFVNHRESAERVFDRLHKENFAVALYHGGMEQAERDRAVICLNNGSKPIMIATDLAARGLDIDSVGAVVHYHLPPSDAAWTHRNGRTARVDAEGEVFVITCEGETIPEYVDWDNDYTPDFEISAPERPSHVTLYVNSGRREKVSRGDLVGLLIKTVGIEASQIGRIDVRDHSAYISLARHAIPMLHSQPTLKVKGVRLKISVLE